MRPFDSLTDEDKDIIYTCVREYQLACPDSVESILTEWDKSKSTLYRLLGNRLRTTKTLKCDGAVSKNETASRVVSLYQIPKDRYDIERILDIPKHSGVYYEILDSIRDNMFVYDLLTLLVYMKKVQKCISDEEFDVIYAALGTDNAVNGVVSDIGGMNKITIKNDLCHSLCINVGMKFMHFMGRLVDFICETVDDDQGIDLKAEYGEFRERMSTATTCCNMTEMNVTISINPVDFIFMSDNDNNWSSCLSWQSQGCHCGGITEMINSDCVIIAYVSREKYRFFGDKYVNSMIWRQMFYVTKDIIVSGKSYPFENSSLSVAILKEIRDLAEKNLGWKYKYDYDEYLDMMPMYDRCQLRKEKLSSDSHRILFDTGFAMYNDMLSDHSTTYWCCRNVPKKDIRINISGKRTCMCCGKVFESSCTSKVVCEECSQHADYITGLAYPPSNDCLTEISIATAHVMDKTMKAFCNMDAIEDDLCELRYIPFNDCYMYDYDAIAMSYTTPLIVLQQHDMGLIRDAVRYMLVNFIKKSPCKNHIINTHDYTQPKQVLANSLREKYDVDVEWRSAGVLLNSSAVKWLDIDAGRFKVPYFVGESTDDVYVECYKVKAGGKIDYDSGPLRYRGEKRTY